MLRMYIDTMHLYNEGLDPAEVIRTYGKRVFSIDIGGENRTAPMLSKLDFPAIARAIRESGFDGVLTFEIPPSPPEDAAGRSLAYIKGLLNDG